MVVSRNTYDLAEGTTPTEANLATVGDAVLIPAPTGAPTATALAAAARDGRGCRYTAIAGEVLTHRFDKGSGALTATAYIEFRVDSTRRPGSVAHTICRARNAANAWKLVETTTGVIQLQDRTTGFKNFNSNTPVPDGWYIAKVQCTVATATTGQISAQIYGPLGGTQISDNTVTATNRDLGTTNITQFQWGKPESGGSISIDIDNPAFDTGSTTPIADYQPSAPVYELIKSNSFEGGSNGTPITDANSGGASGDAFNLVQSNSQTNRFDSANPLAGTLSQYMAQIASSSQINNYWTWSGSADWFGVRFLLRLSKLPASGAVPVLFRGFTDAAYVTPEWHMAINSTGKIVSWEEGQAQVTSTGSLAASTTYAGTIEYRVSTNSYVVTIYARGTNTVVATTSVTLSSPVATASMRYGIGTTVDTGSMGVKIDDLAIGRNGIPPRTDIGNIPPSTTSLEASRTQVEAGGVLTITAEATDPDGSVSDGIWEQSATNGIPASDIGSQSASALVLYARPALVDYQLTVTYIPVDDLGLAGDPTSVTVTVLAAETLLCTGVTGGVPDVSPGYWQVAI